jgi:hypothetical protein
MSGNGRTPPDPVPEPPEVSAPPLADGEALTGPAVSVTARQLGCFIVAAALILALMRALRRRPPAGD